MNTFFGFFLGRPHIDIPLTVNVNLGNKCCPNVDQMMIFIFKKNYLFIISSLSQFQNRWRKNGLKFGENRDFYVKNGLLFSVEYSTTSEYSE